MCAPASSSSAPSSLLVVRVRLLRQKLREGSRARQGSSPRVFPAGWDYVGLAGFHAPPTMHMALGPGRVCAQAAAAAALACDHPCDHRDWSLAWPPRNTPPEAAHLTRHYMVIDASGLAHGMCQHARSSRLAALYTLASKAGHARYKRGGMLRRPAQTYLTPRSRQPALPQPRLLQAASHASYHMPYANWQQAARHGAFQQRADVLARTTLAHRSRPFSGLRNGDACTSKNNVKAPFLCRARSPSTPCLEPAT